MSRESEVQNLLEKGLYHYGLGQTGVAVDLWKKVIELDPENEVAREYLAIEMGEDWEDKLNLGSKKPKPEKPVEKALVPEPAKPKKAYRPEFGLAQQHLRVGRPDLAFSLFSTLLAQEPGNTVYQSFMELSKISLVQNFLRRVKSIGKTPALSIPLSQITELNLTEEEGFILSLINGEISFEDIISLSPVAPFTTFCTLKKLLEMKVIAIKD